MQDLRRFRHHVNFLSLEGYGFDLTNKRDQRKPCELISDAINRGYNKIFLNSAEHEIFPAHKCKNANNCWHFNIYEQEQ